jgi:hypothetical protein
MPPRRPPPAAPRWGLFRALRVGLLLLVLALVAAKTWQDQYRSRRWKEPLYVSIYPVAADDSPVTHRYLEQIDAGTFKDIDYFFTQEARRNRLALNEPFRTRLRAELNELPPARAPDAGLVGTALWSLKLRYWAWRVSGHVHEPEDIRVFVLFHDPALTPAVPHSLGLMKGLIGVVYAFATPAMGGQNSMVIAHEMLHTLGATDKYDPVTDAPLFPAGYAEPDQQPLYPQRLAELMAGRRALDASHLEQVDSLRQVIVGPLTAAEIRWPQHSRAP